MFSADGAKPEKVFPLAEGETRIGRDPENEICVKESTVSRFHCRLVRRGGTVQVFDVKCRNPTRIGKVEADGRTLRAGEVLSVGKLKLKFRDGKPLAKRPAKSPPRPPRLSRKHRDRKSWQRSSQSPVVFAAVLTAAAVVAGGWWLMRSPPEPTQVSDREGGPAPQRGAAMPSASPASGRFAPVPSTGTKSGDLARASGAGIRLGEKRVEGIGAADAADSVDVDVDSVDVDVDVIDVADREADENLAPASESPEPDSLDDSSQEEEKPEVSRLEGPLTAGSSREAYFAAHVLPFLGRYCTSCHGAEKQKGELRLDQFRDLEKALANREVWGKVAEKLREGEMPPKKASQPPDSERGSMLSWIDTAV